MEFAFCVLRKNNRQIILHGLGHIGAQSIYQKLRRLRESCSKKGYLIFREHVAIDAPREGDSESVRTILDWMSLFFESYKKEAEFRGVACEGQELPLVRYEITVDVTGREYAAVLSEDGFLPELDFIKCLLAHERNHEELPDWFLEKLKEFPSREEYHEFLLSSMDLKRYPRAMDWRENRIVENILRHMSQKPAMKGLVIYGNYHIAGFVSILQSKGWELMHQRNLKPRE